MVPHAANVGWGPGAITVFPELWSDHGVLDSAPGWVQFRYSATSFVDISGLH